MAGKEVEMKDAPPTADASAADAKPAEAKQEPPSAASQLQSSVELITKTVQSKETRLGLGRLMRQTATVRKQLTPDVLLTFLASTLPAGSATRLTLESHLRKAASGMDVDGSTAAAPADSGAAHPSGSPPAEPLPEVEAFAFLLVQLHLLDTKQPAEAAEVGEAALVRLAAVNRRTLDVIASRIYFYHSLAHERLGSLDAIRSTLLGLHCTAVLRHDEMGQEVLLNLLLRNYLHYNLYDQAEALRSKAQRPETVRQQQQLARYLYYLGRIQAVQLDYTDAKDSLQQAARKAPPAAGGFRVEVQKWLVLVRLLLGEVPEREELVEAGLEAPLRPYFQITNAVRIGDLTAFRAVAEEHAAVFLADKTANLIVRLRHNVIRTGLRRISLVYSRIWLAEVAEKLGLASAEDTECIVAKAIRDGGIEASIEHEGGWLASKELADVYSTEEPQAAFHARVAFCLDVHNEAVKAMRFEPEVHKKRLETEEVRLERIKAEAELAQALQDAEEDDD